MRVVLKVADGPYEGRTVLLHTGQSVKVGRTEWADFSLPHDNRISSVHFAVECERQRCVVRDLDSTNGTTVNGAAVIETELQDGDVIVAGSTRFQVTVELTASVFDLDAVSSVDATPDENDPARAIAESPSAPQKPSEPSQVSPVPVVSEHASRRSIDGAAWLTVVDKPLMSPALMLAAQSERPYAAALEDPDADVRREALHAAAWCGERWLLEYCRSLANEPKLEHWDAMHLLAILGEPSDLERIVRIGRTAKLGSRRFAIYASYGHPRVIRDLLVALENKDANTAVAAGAAFTKITGADIDSEERVTLQPEDGSKPDEFEQEFLDEAFLPNPKLAQQHWSKVKDSFAEGTRWRRGLNITGDRSLSCLDQLDMEARWECKIRLSLNGVRVEMPTIGVRKS